MSKGTKYTRLAPKPHDPATKQAKDDDYHRELLTDRCLDMRTGLDSTRRRRIAMDAIVAKLEFKPDE